MERLDLLVVAPTAPDLRGLRRHIGEELHGRIRGLTILGKTVGVGMPVAGGATAKRAFQLDPTGTWLYALNQKGDDVVQFAIDQETGELTPTGNLAEVPTPVSLVFTTSE